MHAVDRGNEPIFQFKRDRFVRREHEFLDQLMRLIVLDPLQEDWLSLRIEPHFHFREIEIEGALLEALAPQQRSQFPGDVQTLAQLVVRPGLENRVGLAISQAARAADDGLREARAPRPTIRPNSMKTECVRRSTPGLRLQTPLLRRSGSIGMTRSGR